MSDEPLKKVGGKLVHRGPIASVRMETFQYADGSRATRQVVVHPGAVCVIPHDGRVLYMVEQPREAVEEPALLELPAGKLDVEGETPLECAQRELVEEIGKSAGDWRELKSFYTSPGFTNERVWLFLATELYDTPEAAHRPRSGSRWSRSRSPTSTARSSAARTPSRWSG